jgi:hypothetical protein
MLASCPLAETGRNSSSGAVLRVFMRVAWLHLGCSGRCSQVGKKAEVSVWWTSVAVVVGALSTVVGVEQQLCACNATQRCSALMHW